MQLRMRPLVAVFLTLVCALSLPNTEVRRIRGAAAWGATPLWSAMALLQPSMSQEDLLRQRVRQLELEKALLLQKLEEGPGYVDQPTAGLRVRVLAREAGYWDRFLWIDAGRETHPDHSVLQRQSPVVCGDVVVGLIDYVGRRQSLVRLLSDPQCCPAIQVHAEAPSGLWIAAQRLQSLLRRSKDLDLGVQRSLEKSLGQIPCHQGNLSNWKGMLKGFSKEGTGGPELVGDFFSTQMLEGDPGSIEPSIGQLLVTSGLDGIFPPGLKVGYLQTLKDPDGVRPLREFTAIPALDSFENLFWLTVLSPRGFMAQDRPGPIWEQALAENPPDLR